MAVKTTVRERRAGQAAKCRPNYFEQLVPYYNLGTPYCDIICTATTVQLLCNY